MSNIINIGVDYSRYPAGRFPKDGKYNGETFRKKFLLSLLNRNDEKISIFFDDAVDYGSSFLEEAFGGLVRVEGMDREYIKRRISLHSEDPFLIHEINGYIESARPDGD